MKTLYDISWKVSEEEYRKDKSYSYSTLAKFNREGFYKLNSLFDKVESSSLTFGSMVDVLLTDGKEEFDKLFFVTDFPELSESMVDIVNRTFPIFKDKYAEFNEIPDEEISKIGKEVGFWAKDNWDNVRAKKIKAEKCYQLYNLFYLAEGKKVVSTEEYSEALLCCNILKDSPYTKWYFSPNDPFTPTVERFYQLKFKGEYNNIPLRIMADLIIVDHENRTIIPCDLKTSYKPETEFYKSFVEWRYVIQSQLYWEIINQNIKNDPIYKDYTLLDYRFIVISKGTKTPLVWEFTGTQSDLDFTYGKYKNTIPNWRKIVTLLDYYLKNENKYPVGYSELNNIEQFLNNE